MLLIFAFSLLFCLTACDLYKKDEAPAIVVTSDILTIDDENMRMYAYVSNSVMQFSLIDDIVVPEGVSVDFAEGEIYSQYAHKTVNLNEGANNFRIVFSNGEYEREYEVSIYRKKICEVRFDANNNTPVTVVKVEEGGIVDAPIVKKTGYTFDGWDIDITQPISQSVSTRAKWVANEYILTIDANGGETDVTEITAQYGNTLENVLPTLTRNGYVFASWRIKSTNELYYGGKWNIAHDDTLVAQWTPKFYSVTVENQLIGAADATDAGKIKGTTSYRIGATGTLTAVPTKGFDFVGWYDGDTLLTTNAEFSFPIEGVNLKFVAKFKVKIDGMEKFYFSTKNEVDDYIISGIRENNAEEIYVPDCVVSIEKGAFETARKSLKTYIAPFVGMSATENCNIRNIFNKNGEDSPTNLKTVTVTKAIGDYALYNTRVNEVIIGKDVSSIGAYAFGGCTNLVSVKGAENVKSIGGHAFEKCTDLVSIDGTENVLSIGEYAFSQCERLK
ncbi:MAG: leucine-rich repeat protein, partial [Clostridia bacterium]|nr:leucine-rich repeat protein [Clostridia bacterium]